MDVTVVGGGCLGLSAALHLQEAGHQTTLLEQEQPGAGATGRAAGILSTMTWNDHDFRLIQETRGQLGALISLARIEGEPAAKTVWKPVDSITIARGDRLATLDEIHQRLEHHGEEPERLDHLAAAREFPCISFEPGEEVLVAQEDGAIEAMDLVAVLRCRLENEGGTIHAGVPVQELSELQADAVVVAGGAWTRNLLRHNGVELPLQAFRTQLASLELPGNDVPIVHDAVQGFYLRPDTEGTFMAGDGTILEDHEPDTFNQAADGDFTQALAQRVSRRVEDGGAARIRQGWAGLCVATPDRHPLCGPVPDRDGWHVLTGDNGFGIMRCLALGESLADAIDGATDPILDPRRFDAAASDFTMQEGFAF